MRLDNILFLIIISINIIGSVSLAEELPEHINVTHEQNLLQKTCPVMVGNKINPNIFSIYQGQKVFFCCTKCKAIFDKEPEKYLENLPQFTNMLSHKEKEQHHHNNGSILHKLIVPFGVTTLTLLILTFLAGWFMPKNRKLLFKWHKRLAIITLIIALMHASIVLLF